VFICTIVRPFVLLDFRIQPVDSRAAFVLYWLALG